MASPLGGNYPSPGNPSGAGMCVPLAAVWPTVLQRRNGCKDPWPRVTVAERMVTVAFLVSGLRACADASNFQWMAPEFLRAGWLPCFIGGWCCGGLPRARWPPLSILVTVYSSCVLCLSFLPRCTIPYSALTRLWIHGALPMLFLASGGFGIAFSWSFFFNRH